MLIDWFTVGAQALNFIILVWLMKHFLYQPVLTAIDAREKRIATALHEAATKEEEARREREEFQRKNQEFDRQRNARLQQLEMTAKTEAQQLLIRARQEADELSRRRQAAMQNDAEQLNQAIAERLQQEVFTIARKALTDLANTSLEQQLVAAFVQRLHALKAEAKDALVVAMNSTSDPVLVRSAFKLNAEQKAALQQAVKLTFAADIPLRFETAIELISGIELSSQGQKLAWSIADYLSAWEDSLGELLAEKPGVEVRQPTTVATSAGATKIDPNVA